MLKVIVSIINGFAEIIYCLKHNMSQAIASIISGSAEMCVTYYIKIVSVVNLKCKGFSIVREKFI